MAPPSALQSAVVSDDIDIDLDIDSSFPPLVRSSTVPASLQSHHRADPAHLAPEDAFYAASPPRRPSAYEDSANALGSDLRPGRLRRKDGSRSRSRRRKRFQKLLWVKQSCESSH